MPTVIVLAAGKGERFKASGGTEDKLQSLLCGLPVREHVLAAVHVSGLPWHVVEQEHTAQLSNPGMGDSIATGIAATPDAEGWLILPADLPLIQPSTLLQVAHALQRSDVVAPRYQGEKGHPVGFAPTCRNALLALTGDQGARAVVAQNEVVYLDMDDEGCVLDVDTLDRLALVQVRMQEISKKATLIDRFHSNAFNTR